MTRRSTTASSIAEEDLRLRGPGDFFGARQHGLPELHIADLGADMDVLQLRPAAPRRTSVARGRPAPYGNAGARPGPGRGCAGCWQLTGEPLS